MNTRDKVITTVALTLAAPFVAGLFLPLQLVAPMAMAAPFVAAMALEPAVRQGGTRHA